MWNLLKRDRASERDSRERGTSSGGELVGRLRLRLSHLRPVPDGPGRCGRSIEEGKKDE